MRITESALRRIIRQEARALREASKADKFNAAIASKKTRKSNMSDENQKLASAAMDALTDGADAYDVVKELMSATFASDGRGGGSDSALTVIKLVSGRDPVAGEQLGAAFDEIEQERDDRAAVDSRY